MKAYVGIIAGSEIEHDRHLTQGLVSTPSRINWHNFSLFMNTCYRSAQ